MSNASFQNALGGDGSSAPMGQQETAFVSQPRQSTRIIARPNETSLLPGGDKAQQGGDGIANHTPMLYQGSVAPGVHPNPYYDSPLSISPYPQQQWAAGAHGSSREVERQQAHRLQQQGVHPLLRAQMVTRERGLDIGQAISYGLRATFARPMLWLGGTACVGFVYAVRDLTTWLLAQPEVAGSGLRALLWPLEVLLFPVDLVCFLLTPMVIFLLIKQVDGDKLTLREAVSGASWWRGLAVSCVLFVLAVLPLGVAIDALVRAWSTEMGELLTGSVAREDLVNAIYLNSVLPATLVVVVLCLVSFLETAVYYATEGRQGIVGAFRDGAMDVARNYGTYLLFVGTLAGVGLVVSLLTFGLGMLVVVPASCHAHVFAYRQISRAPYPNI